MSQLTLTLDLTAENLEKLKAFCQETGAETVTKKSATKDKEEEPKTKDAKQAAIKEAKPETAEQEAPEQKPVVKALTKTDVRAVALKLSKAGMSDTLKTIFAKFGASKLSEISEEYYNDLMDELMAVEVDKNA